MKKQSSINKVKVKFAEGELIKVSPPEHLSDKLMLPDYLADEAENYPVFYTEYQV